MDSRIKSRQVSLMDHWYLHPILDSYLLVVATAIVLLAILFVAPSFGRLTKRQRVVLLALRVLVIALVVVAQLRPTIVSTDSRPQSSTLILLLDQSRSMSVADESGGLSRWNAQRQALESALPELAKLRDDTEVLLYTYDESAHVRSLSSDGHQLPGEPTGEQSDIGTSLDEVLRSAAGKRIAAIVLLGDGAQRAIEPKVDLRKPARDLGRLGYPLYTIAFGQPRDQSQTRDVAIENLPDEYTVFVKNELEIRGRLRSQGFVNQDIPVRLVVESETGQQQTLGPIQVRPVANGMENEIKFIYSPQEPGQYKLSLRADDQPGELVTENNQLVSFLTVLEGGLRVLFLHGNIVAGQNQLRLSINASRDIQLDHQWIDRRNLGKTQNNFEDEFSSNTYDVIMIGDVDASAFRHRDLQLLAQSIQAGKGFMMLGGDRSFGPGGYYDTPLLNIIPVGMGRFERQPIDSARRDELHINRPITVLPARPHYITHLASDTRNTETWRRLPPLLGANKFTRIRGTVLLESQSQDALLVASEYGRGRVLAMAGDSTSRWYRYGFQNEHKRFWRQVVLWLARKEESQSDGVWVKLERRRFQQDEEIAVMAGANNPGGDPVEGITLEADVSLPDGSTESITFAEENEQRFQSLFSITSLPGEYNVTVSAKRNGKDLGEARTRFQVLAQELELTDPAADPRQMEQLANLTADAGGEALAPEQLPGLIRKIAETPPKMDIEVQSKWQLADTSTDASLYLILFVTLLGAEWYLRKRWQLV